ncbi:MAG: hypothetical protein PVH03_06505, partial [Chloroflexota bacterium]
MSVLNPNIPTPELSKLMTTAASKMSHFDLKLLTTQLLLNTFLEEKEAVANQILRRLQNQRGFDWEDLARRVSMMVQHTPGRDAAFAFTD